MYLDDGVSRSSAPKDLPQYKYWEDEDAASEYRQVDISQVRLQIPVSVLQLTHKENIC